MTGTFSELCGTKKKKREPFVEGERAFCLFVGAWVAHSTNPKAGRLASSVIGDYRVFNYVESERKYYPGLTPICSLLDESWTKEI